MVIFTALPAGISTEGGRILVDESDYQGVDDEKLPFEIKDVVRIRESNEKFSKFYECMDELGEGKFGKVYRCREKATGLELAAKRIKIKRDADREKVEREVAIMTQLRHPRIAQIYDAFETADNDIVLLMEIVNGGELFDRVVDENYILTELAVVMIICQLCEAISYIHSKNIVHLDIKPENIMCVSQTGNRIKLIDFGLAQFYDGSSNLLFMAGTPEFVAPEVIKFEPIDFHTDMWSIGVITYILLSGISPFLGETLGDTYVAVEKGVWEFDDEAFEAISDAAKDFISKLLIMDQRQRMLPNECLNHPWIVGNRAKAANDLILNQPNAGVPLSKEGLKSYLRNKRFRKAAWALVFLIRFKRQKLMSYERRETQSAVVGVSDDILMPIKTNIESCTESKVIPVATSSSTNEEENAQKVSFKIPLTVEEEPSNNFKAESTTTAVKHIEENKLSSEIPKKKLKPSVSDEKKIKKKAKKHKEKSSEKSEEMSCKSKKVYKYPRTESDASLKQETESIKANFEEQKYEKSNIEQKMPLSCELYVTLETKPLSASAEFIKAVRTVKSKLRLSVHLTSVRRSNREEDTVKQRNTGRLSVKNRVSQELNVNGSSVSKLSDINKKSNSVAAILSMFTEKAEQERKRFERRPSRPVRTFRDVEKPSSRKTSLVPNNENENSCKKLYRAPEEEKERVKNLIELHRRGSADSKQVGKQEIVAIKNEETFKGSKKPDTTTHSQKSTLKSDRNRVEVPKKNTLEKEGIRRKPTSENEERLKNVENKLPVSSVLLPEFSIASKSDRILEVPENTVTKSDGSFTDKTKTRPFVENLTTGKVCTRATEKSLQNARQIEKTLFEISPASQIESTSGNDCSARQFRNTFAENVVQKNATGEGKRDVKNARYRCEIGKNTDINDVLPTDSRNTKNSINEDGWTKATGLGIASGLSSASLDLPQVAQGIKNSAKSISEKVAAEGDPPTSSKSPEIHPKRRTVEKEISEKVDDKNVHTERKKKVDKFSGHQEESDAEKLFPPDSPRKFTALRSLSSSSERKVKVNALKAIASSETSELNSLNREENKSERLKPNSVNSPKANKDSKEDSTPQVSMGISSKKPPKCARTSEKKKVIKDAKKLQKLEDECKLDDNEMNCALGIKATARGSNSWKMLNSMHGPSNASAQERAIVTKVRVQDPTCLEAQSSGHKKFKSSPQKNPLMQVKSEINLAERVRNATSKQSGVTRVRRKAIDDATLTSKSNETTRHSITVASLKHHENFSFGWLKLQLESRVNKEKEEQTTRRPRRELEISPFQTGNAKKALDKWRSMEQSCAARI